MKDCCQQEPALELNEQVVSVAGIAQRALHCGHCGRE